MKNNNERYHRQVIMPEIGIEGQLKLKKGAVLIVGTGGLGSPVAYYLAAAGVGTIGLVDNDVVEISNLQRQIIHSTEKIGVPKVISAKQTLLELNPELRIDTFKLLLDERNVSEIISNYDVIICCVDNFKTRYMLNKACVKQGKPLIEGSIYHWETMVTTIIPGHGPCYNCIRPQKELDHLGENFNIKGVIGATAGIGGSMQAIEALKLLLNKGNLLVGKIFTIDALSGESFYLPITKNPECPVCSTL